MADKLEILFLEDSEDDAKLVERALRTGGIEFSTRRVETREAFLDALREKTPDLILADFKLPHFDGRQALRLARTAVPLTPMILVTGAMLDEAAVDLLREGAADYIIKDRLSRLVPAVNRALADAERARAHAAMEMELKESELRYRRLFESAADGILILDGEHGTIVDANSSLEVLLGYTPAELIGRRISQTGIVGGSETARQAFEAMRSREFVRYEPLALSSKAGTMVDVEVVANTYRVNGKCLVRCNIRDIRERIAAQRMIEEQLDELRQFQRATVDRELRMEELEAEMARLRRREG